ncbi:MAG TPA: metal-dependent hydrolase, partial [Thermoanaerobaculia bacterium]|nr:metal-dependent hydrolase [Thermoanaerobaculia bacterium]
MAGALLARALPPAKDPTLDARLRRGEMLLGFAAAMFPDADALLDPFSPEFYITQHRGLTHSFLLTPLWALLLAALFALRHRKLPPEERARARWRLAAVAAIGVVSHIVLDWITSWGTMFFSPYSWSRYSLDWLFIIDFVLSGLLVLGLLGAWRAARVSDARSRWAARAGLLASTAYVLFCGVRHADALEASRRVLPAGVVSRAAIPQPLSPDRWLLLGDDGKEVSAAYVDLSRHGGRAPSGGDPLPKKGGVRSLLVRLADL